MLPWRRLLGLGFAAFGACALVYGQAITEYAAGVARAGVAGAAGGKSTGKAAGNVLAGSASALDRAGKGAGARTVASASKARPAGKAISQASAVRSPAAPPASPTTPIDPAQLAPGLERQELIEKHGKPSMKTTALDSGQVVEKFWYMAAGRDTVVVTIRDGKVTAVSSSVN